jgi:hypothetical protein
VLPAVITVLPSVIGNPLLPDELLTVFNIVIL